MTEWERGNTETRKSNVGSTEQTTADVLILGGMVGKLRDYDTAGS